MKIPIFSLTVCWLLLLPYQAWGAVIISEIAWMGSSASANYEWIELHNTGTSEVDLTGWQLRDANTLSIDLSGTIAAGGYTVLERNRGSELYLFTPPFLVYTGALVNSGTTVTLYQASGAIADQVAGGENWESIGGDNTTKETPQYSSAGWVTAPPTPGSATVASNMQTTVTATSPAPTNTTGANRNTTVILGAGEVPPLMQTPAHLVLQIAAPTTAYVGQPTTLSARVSGVPKVIANSLKYQWNLGDTHTAVHDEVNHVYDFPGQYVVTVAAGYAAHEATARHTITVLPIKVSLERSPDGDIHIHNDAPYETDLSGYRLVGDKRVVFPSRSIVLPNSTITVAWSRVATTAATEVALYDQVGRLVDYTSAAVATLPAATTNVLLVQSTDASTVPTTSPLVPPQRITTPLNDSNFSFASAAGLSIEESTTPLIDATAAPIVVPTSDYQLGTTSTVTEPIGSRKGQMKNWWTTGGLILLLSGTILVLWWQRRLA